MGSNDQKPTNGGGIAASAIGALVGFGVAKAAAAGVSISPEVQATITVGVYGFVHRLLGRWGF